MHCSRNGRPALDELGGAPVFAQQVYMWHLDFVHFLLGENEGVGLYTADHPPLVARSLLASQGSYLKQLEAT